MNMLRSFGLIALLGLLTACSGLQNGEIFQNPKVSLTGVKVLNMGLFSQSYRLELNIQNPNSFPLPISGLTYGLALNNTAFAKGQANEAVVVPAHGEQKLNINTVSDLATILAQLQQWRTLGRSLSYKLDGELNVMDWAPKVPFTYQGDVKINWGS
jgi:LEA14-like dessication related protein